MLHSLYCFVFVSFHCLYCVHSTLGEKSSRWTCEEREKYELLLYSKVKSVDFLCYHAFSHQSSSCSSSSNTSSCRLGSFIRSFCIFAPVNWANSLSHLIVSDSTRCESSYIGRLSIHSWSDSVTFARDTGEEREKKKHHEKKTYCNSWAITWADFSHLNVLHLHTHTHERLTE